MSFKIMILSGAGLSAESGLKTFRDADGLWENYNVREVCSVEGFKKDRNLVSNFYDERRKQLENAEPNLAHKKLAELQNKYPNEIALVTQNVDNLLEKAGAKNVIHVHGTLTDLRCESCGTVFDVGFGSQKDKKCPKCNSDSIRHNVVMFGEAVPEYEKMYSILDEVQLLVVIGTSGYVVPAHRMANYVDFSILNNLEKSEIDYAFTKTFIEPATTGILKIEKEIEKFLKVGKI